MTSSLLLRALLTLLGIKTDWDAGEYAILVQIQERLHFLGEQDLPAVNLRIHYFVSFIIGCIEARCWTTASATV